MFQKIINACVRMVQRWLPEPFVFAVLLTLIAFLLAMPICHQSPVEVLQHWGGGVWNLLAFAMQMALVLVCGSALATAPPVKKILHRLALIPRTPAMAIAMVTLVSAICCWLNWGFGLIVGVVLAKEVALHLKGVDYRLLIASAYSGFVVWHAGLSGSIPLTMATPGDALTKATNGILLNPIPVSHTILAWPNLLIVATVIVAIVVVNALMHPKKDVVVVDPRLLAEQESTQVPSMLTPAEKMEQSKLINCFVPLLILVFLFFHLCFDGGAFDLGCVILIFMALGMLLHGTPVAYIRAFNKAVAGAAGIILQFPLYAGIMGIITGVGASGISLGEVVSNGCVSISNAHTYPLLTFLCAAILNLFVPSGGGHWAIQAPIMFSAGAQLGVDPGLTGMAIAWGDAWTNLIQPFWALPALAIAKLSAKDIMGFCLIDLLVSGIIIGGGLFLWAL